MIIRRARREDLEAIALVHLASWQTAYRGILPDELLDNLQLDQFLRRWEKIFENPPSIFVSAKPDGTLTGFITGGPTRFPEHPYEAELYAIYLIEEARRQGTGTLLFRQLVSELRRLGYRSMMVLVLKKNPATRFYERLGGRAFAEQDVDIRGIRCREVAYGWSSLEETG